MQIAILGNQISWYCDQLQQAARARGHEASKIEFRDMAAFVNHSACEQFFSYDAEQTRINLPHFDCLIIRTMPPG